MPIGQFQKKLIEEKKQEAIELYKQGLTTREVGKRVGRSHQWVALIVREALSPTAPVPPLQG